MKVVDYVKKAVDYAKKAVLKVVQAVKKIINTIKFFATPLGTVVGWILFIVFAVIVLMVVIELIATAFKKWIGGNVNYSTYESDLAVISDLYNSGYSSQIDPENFVDFKAFEYAVLIDASEYIRNQGQTKFDIIKNQGVYEKEAKIYEKKFGDEYRKARGLNQTSPVAIDLLNVRYDTDQGKIKAADLAETLKDTVAATPRHVNVVDKYDYLQVSGDVLGGNNRVSGPFLVYEFVYSKETATTGNGSGDAKKIGSGDPSQTGSGDPNSSGYTADPKTTQSLLASGDIGGSAIPYIYIIRDEINYEFYFDKDNKAIEIPFLLNSLVFDAGTTSEKFKEANRITADLPIKVWPDMNMDPVTGDYTWTPAYTDESTYTIYKIPLQTLIGRYMPRTELLHAWTMLKQNIAQDSSTDEKDDTLKLIDEVTNKIKQIYSEACLDKETVKTHEKTVTEKVLNASTNEVNEVEKTYKYDQDKTNKTSFVTFKKVGLETTRYKEFESCVRSFSYVSDFKSALLLTKNTFMIKSGSTEISMNIIDINDSGFKKQDYISAYGDEKDGYSPPCNLNGKTSGYLYEGKEESDIEAVKEDIKKKACDLHGFNNYDDFTIESIDIQYSPIFEVKTARAVRKLGVEHRRMPALLVNSATTWARNISYTHTIKQNMFEPTKAGYLLPNSVTSVGIEQFVTSETGQYRGKAYEEIFGHLQEKDVISMLITLESTADNGINDCYEYMRELYKLVMASQEYSQKQPKPKINSKTYTYVYLPNSILYYIDAQTQSIYWQELLGQREHIDALLKEEIESVRTRDPVLKWQIVDYDKYDECNGKVYALNPFGSAYVRAAQQVAWSQFPDNDEINGAYKTGTHDGADLYGRNWIEEFLQKNGTFKNKYITITSAVREYSLKQLESIYNPTSASKYLEDQLKEELLNTPIVAVAPGKVITAGYGGISGFYVAIEHSPGVRTLYCHMKRWPMVATNDYVGAGTLLGYEGNTGRSHGTHLHFQIEIDSERSSTNPQATVNPVEYIYPTFNPFYYPDKAKEYDYNFSSEYMTLYRTVYMADIDGDGNVTNGDEIKNTVPTKALLDNTESLIQKQGTKELKLNMTGDLDWATTLRNDLYIDEMFFDPTKAPLEVDPDLQEILFGYLPVKTDMQGGLPALTRDELEYILQHWLSSRYKEDEYKWLMTNVFTDETIEKILDAQEQYQVSAVFALAVGTLEQQLGISYYRDNSKELGRPDICNIFSIKGRLNGGHPYIGATWNIYDSYGDAFMAFSKLIAGNIYFGSGKYLVATIGPTYCPTGTPPGASWSRQVTTIACQIMQYYTGNQWSTSIQFSDNSEFVGIARNFIILLAKGGFGYGYSQINFNPFTNTLEGSAKQVDCTAYVSGVVRAYARVHNIEELKDFNHGSEDFCTFANKVARGSQSGPESKFTAVWIRDNRNYNHPDGSHPTLEWLKQNMMAGDIIIFFGGHRHTNSKGEKVVEYICKDCPRGASGKGAHHAEIFTGEWNKNKCSIFSCGSPVGGNKTYEKGEATWSDNLAKDIFNGNTRRTLYAILRLKP